MKILILDDSKVVRNYLIKIFKENLPKYETIDFENALDALKYLEEVKGNIDIIFSDIIMPKYDGLYFLEKVKDKWPLLPVIMLTSLDDKDTIKKSLKLGANDFLEKPFNPETVIPAVKEVLEKDFRDKYENAVETEEYVKNAQNWIMNSSDYKNPDFIQFRFKPFKAAGGDFFSTIDFGEDKVGIIIADASGHSVQTSYFVAEFKGILNSVWKENPDPRKLLNILNKKMINTKNDKNTYICITAILWNKKRKIMKIASAAMPHGIILSIDKPFEWIKINGNMVGLIEEAEFEAKNIILKENDRLLFFTDGVIENFDEEEVAEKWQGFKYENLNVAVDKLMDYFNDSGVSIKDDVLIVGIDQP